MDAKNFAKVYAGKYSNGMNDFSPFSKMKKGCNILLNFGMSIGKKYRLHNEKTAACGNHTPL
jgi:hypothetical protein